MRKSVKRWALLAALVLLFLSFDAGIYTAMTRRCLNNFGSGFSARMIEPEAFLPFAEDSRIVRRKADFTLTGDLPVLDGATALLPVYSACAYALYPVESCVFDGTNFTGESKIRYTNTRGAYKAVVDGEADLIFVGPPSKDQLAYAQEKGAELELVPIGREAFVFLVNAKNPVESLTQDEIRGIYTRRIRNWKEVGGANRRINPLQRKEGSGSQTSMLRFMNGEPMKKDPFGLLGASIGFSFRYYAADLVDDAGVKMLSVDGVAPTPETIRSGEYPIIGEFFAVKRRDNENPNVDRVIDWLLSDDGQAVMNETGYVGIR